jgi:DNA-binding SARP family transcriptional activator
MFMISGLAVDPTGSSCRLHLRFLRDFRIQTPRGVCDLRISGKTQEVLAFLALNANKSVRRTTLSGLIWPDHDEQRSRANLNTALWRINRALKTIGNDDIDLSVTASQIKLTAAPKVFIDVLALDACVSEASKSHSQVLPLAIRTTLSEILSGDCGSFLEGLSSEWVLIERERCFNLQIKGLTLLMQDLTESGRIAEALEHGRRILRMDPMRECVQRQVMWLHVLDGHQGNAIRQYLQCARILRDELAVSPMPETRALYEFIIAHSVVPKDQATDCHRSGSSGLPRAVDQVQVAHHGDYDTELSRLRSLITQLNSHRQSVFSVLADSGAS